MKRFFAAKILPLFLIPYVLFFALLLSYSAYSKTVPISYWDEVGWTGRGYFFDLFIRGDFENILWKSSRAYDQPKLTEYVIGAWLYPTYLKFKTGSTKPTTYMEFMMKNGLYEFEDSYVDTYAAYSHDFRKIEYDPEMSGSVDQWVAKYGIDILKPLTLILSVRSLNIILLTLAVVCVYFLILPFGGTWFALAVTLAYGYNNLIVETGVMAQSEALFLLCFNTALLCMSTYFQKKHRLMYLLLFSVSTGLCISTKYNGGMLLLIFAGLNVIYLKRKIFGMRHILLTATPFIISFVMFILLNPFTYSSPLANTHFMLNSRVEIASHQNSWNTDRSLPTFVGRAKRIIYHFYSPNQIGLYNSTKFFQHFTYTSLYSFLVMVLCGIGIADAIARARQKQFSAVMLLWSFVMVFTLMCMYVLLDIYRYYIPIVLFILVFQTSGLIVAIRFTRDLVKRRIQKTI